MGVVGGHEKLIDRGHKILGGRKTKLPQLKLDGKGNVILELGIMLS